MDNYSSRKLELLALKWAVTEKFRDYLLSSTFTVLTDNNPLTYQQSKSKLRAVEQQWVSELASFNFSIKYCAGKQNTNADALRSCVRCMVLRNPAVHHTTPREMDSVSGSIAPSMTSSAPYHPRRRGSGLSTLRNCAMHTMQHHIPLQDIPHTICCLALTLSCLLISFFPMDKKIWQVTMESGLPCTRIDCVTLINKHKINFKQKLHCESNSLTATGMSNQTTS